MTFKGTEKLYLMIEKYSTLQSKHTFNTQRLESKRGEIY